MQLPPLLDAVNNHTIRKSKPRCPASVLRSLLIDCTHVHAYTRSLRTAHGTHTYRVTSLVSDAKLDGMVPFKLFSQRSLLEGWSRRWKEGMEKSGDWVECDE